MRRTVKTFIGVFSLLTLVLVCLLFLISKIATISPSRLDKTAKAASSSQTINSETQWDLGVSVNIDSTVDGLIKINNKTESKFDLNTLYLSDPALVTATINSANRNLVFDGDTGTSWSILYDDSPPHTYYWTVDLNDTYRLSRISVWQDTAGIFQFSTSDNGIDFSEFGWLNGTYSNETVSGSGQAFRYLRITNTTSGGAPAGDVQEVDLYTYGIATHLSASTQLDAGEHTTMNWTTFAPVNSPVGAPPANTTESFRFRTSNDSSNWSNWTDSSNYAASIDIETLLGVTDAAKRYLQVETTLANTDGASTPTLDSYTANYEYAELDHVTISPASASLEVSDSQSFTAVAYDDSDSVMSGATFSWSADCGTIDSSGNYTAPSSATSCTVTAETTIDSVTKSGTAAVTVTAAPPPDPTCSDGIQNQDETGVDCGGVCPACSVPPTTPTCFDGIKNGDETGVDSGGSCPPETPCQFGWHQLDDGSWSCDDPLCAIVDRLTITPGRLDLTAGDSQSLVAKLYRADDTLITNGTVTWETTGGTISDNGDDSARYTAPATAGTYTVTARTCQKSLSIIVTVRTRVPQSIKISANPDEAFLSPGQSQQYSATVTDQNAVDITSSCPVSWSMQNETAGSISSSGLMTATTAQAIWSDSVKATANCYGLSDFSLLSFVTTGEARRLDYVSMSFPHLTAKKGTLETLNFSATALDQFGFRLPSVSYSWKLLDQRIGSFQANQNKIKIDTSDNYGCYYHKVEVTATYNGVTLPNYSSVSIYPSEQQLAASGSNSCLTTSDPEGQIADLAVRLTGAQKALAAGNTVLTKINVASESHLQPGQITHLSANARDQFNNPIAATIEYTLLDPSAGWLSKDGTFIAGNTLGTFKEAIETKATTGGQTLTIRTSVIISNGQRQAQRIIVNSLVKMAPGGNYWLYAGVKDQFGETLQIPRFVIVEDVSEKNLFSVENHSVLKAGGTEGTWEKAIKLTFDIDKLNQNIGRETDKFLGPAPVTYLDININQSYDNTAACLTTGIPTCDPFDPECVIASCSGQDCSDGDSDSDNDSSNNILSLLIKNASKNIWPLLLAALAFLLAVLGLGLSGIINLLSLGGRGFVPFFVKGLDKKKARGLVYDAFSGLGIPQAKVILINQDFGAVTSVVTTDKNGRFALPLKPGADYSIQVQANSFKIFNNPADHPFLKYELKYANNYFGNEFSVEGGELLFDKNIPMIPNANANSLAQKIRTFDKIKLILTRLNGIIITIGFSLSLVALYYQVNLYNEILVAAYILSILFILSKRYLFSGKSFGTVFNVSDSGRPIDLAIVRAVRVKSKKLVKTVVSDMDGKFVLALPKGYYKLFVSHSGMVQTEDLDAVVKKDLHPRQDRIGMRSIDISASKI